MSITNIMIERKRLSVLLQLKQKVYREIEIDETEHESLENDSIKNKT